MNTNKFSFTKFYQKFGTIMILAVVFLMACLLSPNFLSVTNLTNVLRQIAVVGILACGACFVMISGQVNIAYDGLIALYGCAACLIMTKTGNLALSIIVPLVLGVLMGYLFGIFVTVFNVPAFIVGLSFASMGSGAAFLLTGGKMISSTGLGNFRVFGQGYVGIVPLCVIFMIIVIIISHILLTYSRFGRKVLAVGGNKTAAIASGVNANRTIRLVYALDGLFLSLGAVVYMSRLNHGEPAGGAGYAFDALTAACVGGVSISGGSGTITGSFLGAAIVGVLNNILNLMNVDANWQNVVSGIVILVAVCIDMFVQYNTSKSSAGNMKKSAS